MNSLARILGAFILTLLFGSVGYYAGLKISGVLAMELVAGLVAGFVGAVLRITPMDFIFTWLVGVGLLLATSDLLGVVGHVLSSAGLTAILGNLYLIVRLSELTDEERKALLRF
ncbi:MAG: hypothetical protein QXR18_05825 [Pyrobaculum sp.]